MRLVVSQKHSCSCYWIWLKRATANCWKFPSQPSSEIAHAGCGCCGAYRSSSDSTDYMVPFRLLQVQADSWKKACHSGDITQAGTSVNSTCTGWWLCLVSRKILLTTGVEGTQEWICFFKHPSPEILFNYALLYVELFLPEGHKHTEYENPSHYSVAKSIIQDRELCE